MNTRRTAIAVVAAVLFLPVCVVGYQFSVALVGALAEPVIAPVGPFVIIDHFHVELYLEALFLAACLVVSVRRSIVWVVGAAGIPMLPVLLHAVTYLAQGMPPLEHRSFMRDTALWAFEGLAGGAVSCAIWEVASRALRNGRTQGPEGDRRFAG